MKKIAPKPWEKQPNESPPAFEAFAIYRDMGADRSYLKVATKLSKSHTIIKRWGSANNWQERIDEWDNEQDRIAREALTKGVTSMRKRHAEIANALISKGLVALQKLTTDDISAKDIISMIETGIKNERLARGETTDKLKLDMDVPVMILGGDDIVD